VANLFADNKKSEMGKLGNGPHDNAQFGINPADRLENALIRMKLKDADSSSDLKVSYDGLLQSSDSIIFGGSNAGGLMNEVIKPDTHMGSRKESDGVKLGMSPMDMSQGLTHNAVASSSRPSFGFQSKFGYSAPQNPMAQEKTGLLSGLYA